MKKIIGLTLMCVMVALLSSTLFLQDANADFGINVSDAQMAELFGGDSGEHVWSCDTDCDVVTGLCPGGDTCDGYEIANCYHCLTISGKDCSTPSGAGWLCVPGTKSCNGVEGSCSVGMCEPITGAYPVRGTCGTVIYCS